MKFKEVFLAVAVATLGLSANANLVTNGGFEAGNTAGWTTNVSTDLLGWKAVTSMDGISAKSGKNYAETGCGLFCSLSQNLKTTSGTLYDLSFSFNPGKDLIASFLGETKVYFGDVLIADIVGGAEGWSNYSFKGLLAKSTSTKLLFKGYQIPSHNGLDDVNVTVGNNVPEPETLSLIGLALAGLAISLRKSRKAA